MNIKSCTTDHLAFQRPISFFTKFEKNWQTRLISAQTSILTTESSRLQGLGSKPTTLQDRVGFETNGLLNKGKLENKIESLLKKAFMTLASTFTTKVITLPTSLEAALEPPIQLFKRKEPYIGMIKSIERIVGPKADRETYYIVIDHGGNVPYWEGQSYGIIPPGENPAKPSKPNSVRFYSLSSTRYGDNFDGKTASLCVQRAVYLDPETGKEDPTKKGICSNFLYNCRPGDKVQIFGPFGKKLILSKENSNTTHIMVATGTGIAPFRGHLRRMFMEDTI
jgi:ferredoxin--NADP+ reductase